ncbi:MAG: nuclear transport factor 2 family protein [Sphingomonas sp.]|uniref:nuclear transport factor 2 family protein n=1 Tax=Sphingomonas sp. TaxID=28214 RepID=UPI000DB083A9|nr:polyketide cyclase [Zymomonas sp.]MBA4773002.1 nuclear transport factor 2 family protein [Sphingomonas sp.]PZP13269.1 MAG: polyketide cyclase [Sphingomonas hengshuiensis]
MSVVIHHWHRLLQARDVVGLDALVADDCVFQSPAVHTPQVGKVLTIKYLSAAMQVLGTPDFRYAQQWVGDRSAVLEFELTLEGIHVNGVDIIHWNDANQITNFRVMVRPIKGLQTLMPAMAAVLAQLG